MRASISSPHICRLDEKTRNTYFVICNMHFVICNMSNYYLQNHPKIVCFVQKKFFEAFILIKIDNDGMQINS